MVLERIPRPLSRYRPWCGNVCEMVGGHSSLQKGSLNMFYVSNGSVSHLFPNYYTVYDGQGCGHIQFSTIMCVCVCVCVCACVRVCVRAYILSPAAGALWWTLCQLDCALVVVCIAACQVLFDMIV